MNAVKTHLLTVATAAALVGVITSPVFAGADSPFDKIWAELDALNDTTLDLQDQIDALELIPGPQGPQGEQGPAGPTGPAGPAGVASLSKSNVYIRTATVSVEPGAYGIASASCDDADDVLMHGGFWGDGGMVFTSALPRLPHVASPAYWEVAARNDGAIAGSVQSTIVCYAVDAE